MKTQALMLSLTLIVACSCGGSSQDDKDVDATTADTSTADKTVTPDAAVTADTTTEMQSEPEVVKPKDAATEETVCQPDCVGKQCGDDGCDGSCGDCGGQWLCQDGNCQCQADCNGKECGDDGCGGSCGTCLAPGTCVEAACCQPDCDGKECGLDGCGGSCGACPCDTCEDDEIVCQWGGTCSASGGDTGCCDAYLAVTQCVWACPAEDDACLQDCLGETPMYCEEIWEACLADGLVFCAEVCPDSADWEGYPECLECVAGEFDKCVEDTCALVWYGPLSCPQMWQCVLDCPDDKPKCAEDCLEEGNKEAQDQWALIKACLDEACAETAEIDCSEKALEDQCATLLQQCLDG